MANTVKEEEEEENLYYVFHENRAENLYFIFHKNTAECLSKFICNAYSVETNEQKIKLLQFITKNYTRKLQYDILNILHIINRFKRDHNHANVSKKSINSDTECILKILCYEITDVETTMHDQEPIWYKKVSWDHHNKH